MAFDVRPIPGAILLIHVRPFGTDALKVIWKINEIEEGPYFLNREPLEKAAEKARLELCNLLASARDAITDVRDRTVALAQAGAELREAFFTAREGDGGSVLECYLEKQREACCIMVTVADGVHIPWGLMYDGPPASAAEIDPQATMGNAGAPGFWAIKFCLSCVYDRISAKVELNRRGPKQFKVIAVFDEHEFDAAAPHLSAAEKSALSARVDYGSENVTTVAALKDVWKKYKAYNRIVLFFGHADGDEIVINGLESVKAAEMPIVLTPKFAEPGTFSLLILNGCETARGKARKGGFVNATAHETSCGFVGTEVAVPNVFALRFGCALLDGFLETGWPLVQVLHNLRIRHWPVSLAFGLYANPKFQVHREATSADLPNPDLPNFSNGTLGVAP